MIDKKIQFMNILSKSDDLIEYSCPSCGNLCDEKMEKCTSCGFNLKDYKSLLLSKYFYYNEAIKLANENKYFDALLSITKFLAYLPNDQKGNELFIYLIYKTNKKKYIDELNKFEEKFKYSSFIIKIEKDGIDSYVLPKLKKLNFPFEENFHEKLINMFLSDKFKIVNEVIDLENSFFDIVKLDKESNKKKESYIENFYNKKFLQFLSKFEIFVETHNGKIYDKLPDDEQKKLDVVAETESKLHVGSVITITPAIYHRGKLITKERVLIVKKTKRW